MANTVETMGDTALLRAIIDRSIEDFEDDTLASLRSHAFRSCTALESVKLPNATLLGSYAFCGCSALEKAYLPKVTQFGSSNTNNYVFQSTSVPEIVLPSIINMGSQSFHSWTGTTLDFGENLAGLYRYTLQNIGSSFSKLILRKKDSVVPLENTAAMAVGKFASNGSGGTLYVPQALITDYQNATNWSTILGYTNNKILPIEGSEYEIYYADGTPVGLSASGMIAHFDTGSASQWDSETKAVTSRIDTDLVAWNTTSQWDNTTLATAADVPTEFYDGMYSKSGIAIDFGKAMSEVSDTITLEFCYGSTNKTSINLFASRPGSSGAQIWGYLGKSFRTFRHVLLEVSASGSNIYVDGVKSAGDTTNRLTYQLLRVISGDSCYIGKVSVYDRALTEEERAEHYQYYVGHFHVGETAYDSSGNFVAT